MDAIVAALFHRYLDAVAFHGVEDHAVMHEARRAFARQNATSRDAAKAKTATAASEADKHHIAASP